MLFLFTTTLKRCGDCTGRFSSYFISGRSRICKLYVMRNRMEDRLKEEDDNLTVDNSRIAKINTNC